MWALRACNRREFCNTADEHHALCLGLFTPFFMWPFLTKHCPEVTRLLDIDPWYISLGMGLRSAAIVGLILLSRRTPHAPAHRHSRQVRP